MLSVASYKPFGTPVGVSDTDQKLKYADEMLVGAAGSSPELYYIGARWMNPELGRWLSLDPELGKLSAPQTQNRYVYCVNNPLRFVDPTGQGFWSWLKGLFFDDDYCYTPVDTQVETRNGEPTLVNRWVPPWENKGWQVSVGTVLVVGGAEVGLAYLGTDLTTAISSDASWLGSKLSSRSAQAAPQAAPQAARVVPPARTVISNPWVSPNAQRFGTVSFGRVSIPAPPNVYPVSRPDYATFFKGLDYECMGTRAGELWVRASAQSEMTLGSQLYRAGFALSSYQQGIWEGIQYVCDFYEASRESRHYGV